VLTGELDRPDTLRFLAFENQQDALHASDPVAHPRDARTAYSMNPLKLQRLVDAEEAAGRALIAIVHSHPQHPAYFSRTDAAAAAPWGLPTWPQATQLVVSVYDGQVRDLKGFVWVEEDWQEQVLEGVPPLLGPPPGARPMGEV
jgi:proteasome lid subunit RPN8/RPN11